MALEAFAPAGTTTIAASTTTASGALTGSGDTALIYNATAAVAFVAFGVGSATATNAGFPVPPSSRAIIKVGPLVNYAAAILASGSGNVYVTLGSGSNY